MNKALGLMLAVMLTAHPAAAQTADRPINGVSFNLGDTPITLDAANGVEWNQDKGTVAALAAVVRVGVYQLNAARVEGQYQMKGDTPQLSALSASGGLTFQSAAERLSADGAQFDVAAQTLHVMGKPARAQSTKEQLAAPQLSYHLADRRLVARGGAELKTEKATLSAGTLTAFLSNAPLNSGKKGTTQSSGNTFSLDRAEAEGNVTLRTATDTLSGDKANYNAATGVATVTGAVRLMRGSSYLSGTRAEINMKTGVSTLSSIGHGGDGRVRGQILPDMFKKPASSVP